MGMRGPGAAGKKAASQKHDAQICVPQNAEDDPPDVALKKRVDREQRYAEWCRHRVLNPLCPGIRYGDPAREAADRKRTCALKRLARLKELLAALSEK